VTALKRAVERALRWYLPPVTEQVSRHNQAVLEVLAEHNRQIVELRRELEALRRRLAALESERRRSR
jgi:polyhydroxyalkanoate synthesis regulator phasin